jgi:hypothetical protein
MADVRAWLAGQEKTALVDLLMEQARADGRLRQRLVLEVARRGGKGIDLRTYRRAIDAAVDVGGFVDYEAAFDYAEGIEDAVKGIEALLKDGHAAEVIELAEYALERAEGAIEHMDDSDGYMGGILEKLQSLHLAACKQAKPDPVALTKRLFAWELRTPWDTFFGAARTYAGVLGKAGMAEYRRLAEAEWARVPVRGPEHRLRDDFGKHFRITHIMETLAEETGDVEALVRSSSATSRYRMPISRLPSCTRRRSSRTGHSNGPSEVSRPFRIGRTHASRIFWPTHTIAGNATTRRWP